MEAYNIGHDSKQGKILSIGEEGGVSPNEVGREQGVAVVGEVISVWYGLGWICGITL